MDNQRTPTGITGAADRFPNARPRRVATFPFEVPVVLKYPSHSLLRPLLAVVLWCAAATPASAQLILRFEVSQAVISPDGDGRQDSTRVRYALADTALAVSVVIFQADSVTPVDTLRAPAPDFPGTRDRYWKGRRWDGSAAGEGSYVVVLRAIGKTRPDSVLTLPVFVDLTPPRVQILSVTPNPYAPGLAGASPAVNISHVISNTSPVSPGRTADRLDVTFHNPSGAAVTAQVTTSPPYSGAGGNYISSWNASDNAATLPDGEYEVVVTVDDAAGYVARSVYHFEIDTAVPVVVITSPPENARVRVVPANLRGRAFDRRGVDSLYVKYPSSPYQRVASTMVTNDTLVFSVPLADSVTTEGTYRLKLRAVDKVGRSLVHDYTLTYDLTAPVPPVLDASGGTWHTDRFPLSGRVDNGGDTSSLVRILRNGAVVDSVPTALSARFTVNVPLVVGRNDLVAYQRDGAGNLSEASNTIVVAFKSTAGLFFPVPFAPGGSFQVNADRIARSATLRVFDVTGDLVTRFEDGTPRQYYAFDWNGRNSSDRAVRRGPLVAVAVIDYDDGTRDVFRETFLFDSNPR